MTWCNRFSSINKGNDNLKILGEELQYALKTTKNEKVTVSDQIPVETLKCLNKETTDLLLDLFNTVFISSQMPNTWLLSTFCPLPKTSSVCYCNDYRIILIMSHTRSQFGFWRHEKPYYSLNASIQRCLDIN